MHRKRAEPWRVTLVDTGDATMTGGRLKRAREYLGDDAVLHDLRRRRRGRRHRRADRASTSATARLATVTAVQPPGRFGVLDIDASGRVGSFREKPQAEGGWINGGFFVLSPKVLDYIAGDATPFESEPLEQSRRATDSSGSIATPASGSRWTRCATSASWKSCGQRDSAVEDLVMTASELLGRQAAF